MAFTDNEPEWEADMRPGVHYVPLEPQDRRFGRLLVTIDEAKRANGMVIVSAHWGPNWGYAPLEEHARAAHLFIDAGADIVCGHSSHVVRGIEIYRNRPILYSCGNFIDDYAVDEVERNDESCVFCLDYEGEVLQQILLVPTMIEGFQATLARGVDRARIAKKTRTLCASLNTDAQMIPEGLKILPSRAAPTHIQVATA
jgi:poly-gamma-glutamate synthesis protein (capsule biosynthesis protein)